ncbi:MAG: NAD-dependent DNA ligase LigA [Candidatus Hodarchaeales archaeon]
MNKEIETKKGEIKHLENQILYHKKKYYDGEPEISDQAYDALEEKLKKLDPNNPVLFLVGTPVGGKVLHEPPMLSCQKASDIAEVVRWSNNHKILVGYKIDGFSLSLMYNEGKFIQAATRGNGYAGDDSTIQVMKIKAIPKTLPIQDRVNIRGEIYMPISEFKNIIKQEATDYNSPRNLAVGTLKQKDLRLLEKRKLGFFAFDLLGYRDDADLMTKKQVLESWGFQTAGFKLLDKPTTKNITEIFKKVEEERSNLDFEIDGIVLKYNDAKARANAGSTEHHPKWMIALKFTSEGDTSIITDITWQVGRTGVLTPVAEIEPVKIMGAEIRRATLHNAEFLEKLDAAKGDLIYIVRSGDVIPKIEEIVEKGPNHAVLPKTCPSCQSKVIRDGVNLVCKGSQCRDREIQRIRHWVKITEIDGLGPKNIARLYDEGLVRHFSDLYDKNLSESDLVSILGKNGEKIYKNIQYTKTIPFSTFLAALGIESLGKRMGKVLANHFETFEDLKSATLEDLVKIEGISDLTASYIMKGLNDPDLADRLFEKGVKISYEKKRPIRRKEKISPNLSDFFNTGDKDDMTEETPLIGEGKVIYVTGKIPGMSKKEVKARVEELGFEWASSISKRLAFLVVGEKAGKAKLTKVEKLGVPIKTWEDFKSEYLDS